MVFNHAGTWGEDRSTSVEAKTQGMKSYTLRFSQPVSLTGDWNYGDPKLQVAQHRALRTRKQAIRRRLRSNLTQEKRNELEAGLQLLDDMETEHFGIHHRSTRLPLDNCGKLYVPVAEPGKQPLKARGRRHVPLAALPFDALGRRYIPSPREIVEEAVFRKYADKDNQPMALAKLAAINPENYVEVLREEAKIHPRVRRARNRVGSDVEIGWPPKNDEMLVLSNFYATEHFPRPLMGMADEDAVEMLSRKNFRCVLGGKPSEGKGFDMSCSSLSRYRRILRKFFLV
jgi:hypothetical protein